jgi:hypothetical protein
VCCVIFLESHFKIVLCLPLWLWLQIVATSSSTLYHPLLHACAGYLSSFSPSHVCHSQFAFPILIACDLSFLYNVSLLFSFNWERSYPISSLFHQAYINSGVTECRNWNYEVVTPVHNLAIQMQILKGIFTFLLTCKVTNMMHFLVWVSHQAYMDRWLSGWIEI